MKHLGVTRPIGCHDNEHMELNFSHNKTLDDVHWFMIKMWSFDHKMNCAATFEGNQPRNIQTHVKIGRWFANRVNKNKLYWTVIFKLITAIASSLPTSPFTEHNLVDLARRGQQKQISEQKN